VLLEKRWLFGIAAFYIVATGPSFSRNLNLYAGAMAWSTIFVNVVLFFYGVDRDLRSSLAFTSSLSNPNIAALQLLLGFPFMIFWIKTRGLFSVRGMLGLVGIAMMIYEIVMRTGSRSGLLILGIMTLITLWTTKALIRIALIATLVIGAIVAIPFVPGYLVSRYATIFSSAPDANNEAVASARERQEILKQSIILTLQHPLVGVGPGQFQVAEAAVSKDEGVRAMWLVTHNAYTQLSSETGMPGLIFYTGRIGYSLFPVWTDYRKARREKRLEPREQFALALLISAAGLLINSAFTSVAYDYYWPILCAMGIAYQRLAVQDRAVSSGAVSQSFAPGLRPGQAPKRYRAEPERPGTDYLDVPLRS
jgi:O-antigen ligase